MTYKELAEKIYNQMTNGDYKEFRENYHQWRRIIIVTLAANEELYRLVDVDDVLRELEDLISWELNPNPY